VSKGLYTNSELIETLIVDLNNILRDAINGQFVHACSIITQMSQKLLNLRKTIDDDLKNRNETIEQLKAQLRECGVDVVDMSPEEFTNTTEKGGGNDGSN
jgi:uncharacterized protein YoxC